MTKVELVNEVVFISVVVEEFSIDVIVDVLLTRLVVVVFVVIVIVVLV